MNSRTRASRAIFAFLRAHRGKKFSPAGIAEATGYPVSRVVSSLTSTYAHERLALHREGSGKERAADPRNCRYWIEEPQEAPSSRGPARLVMRWMLRHRVAAVPSDIAKGTGFDVREVDQLLQEWARTGVAVRCELLNRRGPDRYEYRITHCPPSHFGRVRNPAFHASAQ
jgi:hypothetical protein